MQHEYVVQLQKVGATAYVTFTRQDTQSVEYTWPYFGGVFIDHTTYFLKRIIGDDTTRDVLQRGAQAVAKIPDSAFDFVASKEYSRISPAEASFTARVVGFLRSIFPTKKAR